MDIIDALIEAESQLNGTPVDIDSNNAPTSWRHIKDWKQDDNTFWAAASGHHQNAIDMLVDAVEKMTEILNDQGWDNVMIVSEVMNIEL